MADNVYNHVGEGAKVGHLIQGGDFGSINLGGSGGEISVNGVTVSPEADLDLSALEALIDLPGPLLALFTKGEAQALYPVLALAASAVPEAAGMVTQLAERLNERLQEHGIA